MSIRTIKYYGQVGTKTWYKSSVNCNPSTDIEISGPPPQDNKGPHVISQDGSWELPSVDYEYHRHEEIRIARQLQYLDKMPIEVQLEALMEDKLGRPEKLQKLLQEYQNIRNSHPYPSE